MPLESLGKNEQLNIKKIETSEVKSGRESFDAREEVSEQRWDIIRTDLMELLEDFSKTGGIEFPENAATVVQLFPEKRDELGLNEAVAARVREVVSLMKRQHAWGVFVQFIAAVKILFPNQTNEQLGVDAVDWAAIENFIHQNIFGASATMLSDLDPLVAAYIAFPEHCPEISMYREGYDDYRSDLDDETDPQKYLKIAAQLRLLCPQFMTRSELAKLNWDLIETKPENITDITEEYISYLFYRQIIAAEKVEITPHGVEFTMSEQKDFVQKSPPLPETKKT